MPSRQSFLSFLLIAGSVPTWGLFATAAEESPPIVVGELPLLFVDDGPIHAKDRIVRTVHAARTMPEPVVAPEKPWERDRVYVYGSVHPDPKGGWGLWYMAVQGLKGPARLCYATSLDGIAWQKPNLGFVEFEENKETNILRANECPSIIVDRFDTDPAKRYKMISVKGPKQYLSFYSADGLQWTAYEKRPNAGGDDTLTLSQNPLTGEYLLYHKSNPTVRGKKRRSVYLSRSSDFENWSKSVPVLLADETDDQWVENDEQSTQFYNMSVYPHAGGFVGLATVFRVMQFGVREPGRSSNDGPIDVQMTTSTDGVNFRRTWPRINVIPRGAPGSFDGGAILGCTNTLLETNDETSVYYTGLTTGHGGPVGPKKLSIGRAAWRRSGFASLDADPVGGRVETKPLRLTHSTLVVNADAHRGELRVALLEADGRPIAGYELENSDVLRRDHTHWYASWDKSAEVPTDRPVRVVVEMTSSRLYALSTRELPKP